jgi:hypothetical protein
MSLERGLGRSPFPAKAVLKLCPSRRLQTKSVHRFIHTALAAHLNSEAISDATARSIEKRCRCFDAASRLVRVRARSLLNLPPRI